MNLSPGYIETGGEISKKLVLDPVDRDGGVGSIRMEDAASC